MKRLALRLAMHFIAVPSCVGFGVAFGTLIMAVPVIVVFSFVDYGFKAGLIITSIFSFSFGCTLIQIDLSNKLRWLHNNRDFGGEIIVSALVQLLLLTFCILALEELGITQEFLRRMNDV